MGTFYNEDDLLDPNNPEHHKVVPASVQNLNIDKDRFLEAHFTEGFFLNSANFFIGLYE